MPGSLTLSVPRGNPLFHTLTLYPARGQPRRRSDERVYVRKSGPKLQVARPGLGSAVSTAPTATRQGEVRLVTEQHCTRSSSMRQILGGVQCLPNRFSASLTSATLHASLGGYEYAGRDPSVPARASKPCVPPLREARCQSFMK